VAFGGAGRPARPRDEPGAGRLERPVPAVRPGRSRLRTVVLAVLASLVLLLVAGTTGALVAVDRLDSRVQRFPDPFESLPTRPPTPEATPGTDAGDDPPLTVLVLGSTDDLATEGDDGWAAAAATTDVVMLARVAADRRSAQVVAMPPELWVEVPDSGPGELRSAVALGGPTRTVQTVEQLTGVRVDHVALTDAATFARVTESLGGVDLDVAADVVVGGRVVVPAGRQRLSGERALLWVQGTTADDGARTDRQQAWLRAILDRLGDDDVRGAPAAWLDLLGVVSGSVAVDEGLDRGTMLGLLTGLRGMRPDDVDVVAAPTTSGTAPDGHAVVVPDPEPFAALMAALRSDTLREHLTAAGAG
jgi:LCP family protein required for cell wall assembly